MTIIDPLALGFRRVASTNGGEYAGPCPLCGGRDRLRVWPNHPNGHLGRWWCRRCGKGGDLPALLVELGQIRPTEAAKMRQAASPLADLAAPLAPRDSGQLAPPGPRWQAAARAFVSACQEALWAKGGRRALDWLRGRGLTDDTIRAAGLGYNPQDQSQPRPSWGLDGPGPIWLPRGVVIPWVIAGDLWRVNIRRPQGEPKYVSSAGFSVGLYNADALAIRRPAVLVEGEFDALTLEQAVGDLVVAVATGSTGGARKPRWIAALATCPLVLVGFDSDAPGEKAATWWVEVLPNSRRWRPLWGDVNQMAQDGVDLRQWVLAALEPPGDFPAAQQSHHMPTWARELPIKLDDWGDFVDRHNLHGKVRLIWPEGSPSLVVEALTVAG